MSTRVQDEVAGEGTWTADAATDLLGEVRRRLEQLEGVRLHAPFRPSEHREYEHLLALETALLAARHG